MRFQFHLFSVFAVATFAPLSAQVATDAPPVAVPQAPVIAPVKLDQSTPEATLNSIVDNLKAGKPHAILSALTTDDTAEIQTMVQGVIAKVDPKLYDQVVGVVSQLGTVLTKNSKFIANNKMLNDGKEPAEVENMVKSTCEALTSMKDGQMGSHAKASKFQLKEMLAVTGGKVLTAAMTPGSGADVDFEKIEIGEAKIDGESAYVTVSIDGEPQDFKMKSIQGKWYFDVTNTLAEAKEQTAEMKPMTKQDAMQVSGMLNAMIVPLISKFDDIESQEEFDDEVSGVAQMLMGMLGGFGGGGGFSGPPGGGGR